MEVTGKKKIRVGRIIGNTLEFFWFLFKLAVVISIVTAVVGFLLSRSMMIRGRNGVRQATEGMKASSTTLASKSAEDEKVAEWLKSVKREKLTMKADDDYVMVARQIVINPDEDRWVVILHGYNGSMEDVYDIAMHYSSQGYNVLLPDMRANGESEGSFIGMGWLDRIDLINWIDVILEANPSAKIAVHGIDIGGEAAIMMTGEALKSSVKVVVAEGTFTSAEDVMKQEYEKRYPDKPVFPFFYMMNPVSKVWGGYSLKEADAVSQVSKAQIPILLIHGAQDTYATKEMTDKLNAAIASQHDVVEITSGMHDDNRYVDMENYYSKSIDFVNSYMK